jgi:hypothetical protein
MRVAQAPQVLMALIQYLRLSHPRAAVVAAEVLLELLRLVKMEVLEAVLGESALVQA